MDNQDKLFEKIKEASQKAEFQDFPAMDKVWSRVEEKLDKKEDKKTITLWKKIAVAASFLLVISLGYQFLHSDSEIRIETPKVVIQDNVNKKPQEPIQNRKEITPSSNSGFVSGDEAVKILEKHSQKQKSVAVNEESVSNAEITNSLSDQNRPEALYEAEAAAPVQKQANEEQVKLALAKEEKMAMEYSEAKDREYAKVALAEKSMLKAKSSRPLVVLNGNPIAHSDDVKKDKMIKNELPNLSPENLDSLVVLDEPLYIIDGVYYSENDLFGDNPTSPYAPLDKQDIKTITILQDLEATEKYGERGKKGVVIITTKKGKPTPKK